MSYAESPVLTTLRFINNGWTEHPNRLTAELITLNRETHRQTDVYHFNVLDGQLIDPETGRPVLDFVMPGIERYIAVELQNWADKNSSGVAFWISPKLPGTYPCNKIIIHNIAYGVDNSKVVMNSVILFEGDLRNPEELRETLFTAEDKEETFAGILEWLNKVSSRKVGMSPRIQEGTRQMAVYFANQIRSGIDPYLIVAEMQRTGFLGKDPITCPPATMSFSSYVDMRARRMEATGLQDKKILCCTCPFCNKQVKAEIYDGRIHCPECGKSREWKEEQSQSL